MAQSLSSVLIHLVFSTKNREPFITDAIEGELQRYMAKIFRELKSHSLAIDGTADHIHALFSLLRVIAVADLVEEIKTSTSKWIKQTDESSETSTGRVATAHSPSANQTSKCESYIRGQEKHHQRRTFQDELRKFLKAYQIPYDERYVWD